MLEVRRMEPGARGGAAPAETRGGARTGLFTKIALAENSQGSVCPRNRRLIHSGS
jgi:hypothetical protein